MSAPAASPTDGQLGPGKTLRYSELTPAMISVLRVYRAIEQAYPQAGDRCTKTLAGHAEWLKRKPSPNPQAGRDKSRESA